MIVDFLFHQTVKGDHGQSVSYDPTALCIPFCSQTTYVSPRWNGAKDQLLDIGYQKSVKRGGPFHEFLVEDQAQPDGRTPRKSLVCIDRNITVLRNSDEKDEKNKKEGQKDESALESAKWVRIFTCSSL